MKKTMKKIISLILTVAVFITGTTVFVSADNGEAADNGAIISVTNVANGFLEIVFERFGSLFPDDFISVEEYYAGESENFYEGTEIFLDAPARMPSGISVSEKQVLFPKISKTVKKHTTQAVTSHRKLTVCMMIRA